MEPLCVINYDTWVVQCVLILSLFSYEVYSFLFFFFNDTATTEIYTLSLHDALPISDLERAEATGAVAFPSQAAALEVISPDIIDIAAPQIGRAHV